jgi:hydroxyacylglutathione hydrolase
MDIVKITVGALASNCYLVRSAHTGVIIDPGAEADKILAVVRDTRIEMILATHGHFDHVTALQGLKGATGASAAIHAEDWMAGFDLELVDGQIIRFGEETMKVLHTPGHTPGGCCFLVKDRLFSGDTLFPNGPGNTAFPGGDHEVILRGIREKLMVLPDETVVYPGHGPETTIGRERALY